MLSLLSPFSTISAIESDMGYAIPGLLDPFISVRHSPLNILSNILPNIYLPSTKESSLHIISIDLGYCYKEDNITITIDGKKVKVSGKAIESLNNGSNIRQFEREYQIPDDVDISTMRSELSNKILYITFDKKHVEPKKMLEDLSNDQEFRICANFEDIKPEELTVRIVGSDLIVEGNKKCSCVIKNDHTYSSSCNYVSSTIQLPESVEVDKLRAVISEGGLEIFAPKDPSKIKPKDRLLKIENME